MPERFNWSRLLAIVIKEFIQLSRDRLTFAMMIGIPLIQLTLFGFAINGDPKHLPTVVVAHEQSSFSRTIVSAMSNSGYFHLLASDTTEAQANAMLQRGEVQFVLTIPADFSRRVLRGERPAVLLEADATDPQCRQDRRHGKCVSDNRQAYETQGVGNTPDDDCFCLTDPLHDAASKEGLHENLYDPEDGQGDSNFDGTPVEAVFSKQHPGRTWSLPNELNKAECD